MLTVFPSWSFVMHKLMKGSEKPKERNLLKFI